MENTIENLRKSFLDQIQENTKLIAENFALKERQDKLGASLIKLIGVIEYLEDKIEQYKEECDDCESFQPEEVEEW